MSVAGPQIRGLLGKQRRWIVRVKLPYLVKMAVCRVVSRVKVLEIEVKLVCICDRKVIRLQRGRDTWLGVGVRLGGL